MSGVFGYVHRAAPRAPGAVVRHMGAQLRHVAQQQAASAEITPTTGLGHLHIGLLNSEPQPLRSADGAVALVLCGEFYHQEERRRALVQQGLLGPDAPDSALALCVFLQGGAVGLSQLDGAFTCAVWDGRSDELWVVNDRYGLYPHYYAHTGGGLAFAPEIKAVLAAPGVPRKLDETAVAEYLRFQQLLGERTWLQHVQVLPPATLLHYRPADDRLSMRRYWDWDRIEAGPAIGFDDAVAEASALFQRAVDAMTAPPLRPGIFLSGGLDGRIILAFAQGARPQTLTFGAPGIRDVIYGARLARRAGVPHRWFPFVDGRWVLSYHDLHLALTEGMHSWMHMHGISTLAEARTLLDVNLSGWDGATTMGGYAVEEDHARDRYFRIAPDEVSLTQRLYGAFCELITWPSVTEAEAATLLSGAGRERLRDRAFESLRAELAKSAHYPPHLRTDYFVIHHMVRRGLQNQIVTQRSRIEVRCPYFDYRFVEFMYGLPDAVRCDPNFRRAILTRRSPALAMVPYDKDDRLPHSSAALRAGDGLLRRAAGRLGRFVRSFQHRPKLYADYEHYLRTDLRPWAEGVLFSERTRARGLFDEAAVRSLWNQHLAGDRLWTIGKVAPLITLEMVLRQLVDEPDLLDTAHPPPAQAGQWGAAHTGERSLLRSPAVLFKEGDPIA